MLVNPRDRYFKNKGIEEGKAEGIDKGKLEVAVNLINSGFGIDEVVELTGLDKKVIECKIT